uniref:Uncharacterized protein isoform X2 n=1 Tax=Nicotiana tabacum TaxID=4097 RepID=A0A1S4BQB6_TOBAC|nr:PREDICTED: uncharacterized protein LOC107810754 isoform X2 [Nicotiana tabacum]
MILSSDQENGNDLDYMADQSLAEIAMEQGELSDSEEEIGEGVEFECEEMEDSEGEEIFESEEIINDKNEVSLKNNSLKLLRGFLGLRRRGDICTFLLFMVQAQNGEISQCCLTKHVFKMTKQFLANVSLKINVKVEGRNTVLVDVLSRRISLVSDRPTIIFGADVTHPPLGRILARQLLRWLLLKIGLRLQSMLVWFLLKRIGNCLFPSVEQLHRSLRELYCTEMVLVKDNFIKFFFLNLMQSQGMCIFRTQLSAPSYPTGEHVLRQEVSKEEPFDSLAKAGAGHLP